MDGYLVRNTRGGSDRGDDVGSHYGKGMLVVREG
jgi:hypothetical protein